MDPRFARVVTPNGWRRFAPLTPASEPPPALPPDPSAPRSSPVASDPGAAAPGEPDRG